MTAEGVLAPGGHNHQKPLANPKKGGDSHGAEPPEQGTVDEYLKLLNEQAVKTNAELHGAMLGSIRRNMRLNTAALIIFYFGAASGMLFTGYVLITRFDAFIQTMVTVSGGDGDGFKVVLTVLALTLPILLATGGVVLCVAMASTIQGRGNVEFSKAQAQISRSIRETPLAPGRSLALTQIMEETLANARQAFGIQIWISRVLFGTGIALLFVFVASLFSGSPVVSGGAAVTSLLALVAAAVLNPQRQIRSDLAHVTQLGVILAGYTRQASIIEDYLYQEAKSTRAVNSESFYKGVERLQNALEQTVRGIAAHVQAPDEVSSREVWLWQQLSLGSPTGHEQPDSPSR